jgi:hypothetical protein
VKRFRYTVENFLPREHASWGSDLKELQDVLGEVHDLDVLWGTAVKIRAFPDTESRQRWRQRFQEERAKRIARYREKMLGPLSLWRVWRTDLPSGPQVRSAALNRLQVWAGFLDPDLTHSQRVARIALQLYDALHEAKLLNPPSELDLRSVLQIAALLHDVGKAKGGKGHQKDSFRLIRNLTPPLGWDAKELRLAAAAARYHRGALPRRGQKALRMLTAPEQTEAIRLAGVLRLANALDPRHEIEPNLKVTTDDHKIILHMAGYSAVDRRAETVAAARHLLETVLRRAVLVRPLRMPSISNQTKSL